MKTFLCWLFGHEKGGEIFTRAPSPEVVAKARSAGATEIWSRRIVKCKRCGKEVNA